MKSPLQKSARQVNERARNRLHSTEPSSRPQSARPSSADLPEPYKKALQLWLEWNEAYEQMAARMFESGQDQRAMEDMMDQMDRLRTDVVELTRDLLD